MLQEICLKLEFKRGQIGYLGKNRCDSTLGRYLRHSCVCTLGLDGYISLLI